MNDKIRVAICDDDKFLCEGFRMQFELYNRVCVVGMAYNSEDCLQMLTQCNPQVLLLDIRMESEEAGLRIISKIKNTFPSIKIMMLTSYDDSAYIYDAIAEGADDYCLKTMDVEHLTEKIESAVEGRVALEKEISDKIVSQSRKNQSSFIFVCNKILQLSDGELDFLRELYQGESYRTIAKKNYVQLESVKKMAHRILKKTGNRTIQELVNEIRELDIFEFIDKNRRTM